MGNHSERNRTLTPYEKKYIKELDEGLERNASAKWQHTKDTFSNGWGIVKGTGYLWFDDGTFYSNIFAHTKTIDQIFDTEVKWNGSSATKGVKESIKQDAAYYQAQVKAGNGKAYHVLHVSTKIIKKHIPEGNVAAKDVFNIMCSSVKDYVAPAKSNETAGFDPSGPTIQHVPRVNLFGATSDNPINTTAYLDKIMIVNETMLGHLLHPGKIFRFITESDDTIYSNTIGIGNAQYISDGVNIVLKKVGVSERINMLDKVLDEIDNNFLDNVVGARIFKNQDINLKNEVKRLLNTGYFKYSGRGGRSAGAGASGSW
jgi:hypothetical protein